MKIKRNYYRVEIPCDIGFPIQECAQAAISEVENRTRKFFLPQTWQAKLVGQTHSNYIFQVIRYHN